MKKILVLFLVCVSFSVQAFAKISFGVSDLNSNDEVLFTVKQDMAGINPYKSLFYSKLVDGQSSKAPLMLTCYPEQMELLEEGTVLQIRNRYGIGRYNSSTDSFKWVEAESKIPVNSLPVTPYSASPDGKYYCLVDKTSFSNANLILVDAVTGKNYILCDKTRQSYEKIPVKWSLDGSVLIYEKENELYFCKPDALLRGIEMDEKYRKIGRGSINSVNWASERYLIYVDDYLVYQINAKELYTLGLYSGILGQGKAIGRLPSQFNCATDKFSVNSNLSSMVLIQNGSLISYLKIQQGKFDYLDVVYSRPYIDSSASLVDAYVFWDASNSPVLWLEKLPYDSGSREKGSVYKLTDKAVSVLEIEDSGKPFISPDGRRVAFFAGSSLMVYDVNTWKKAGELNGDRVISAIWAGNSTLYVGGEKYIRKWNLIKNSFETKILSSANAGYWDKGDGSVLAEVSSEVYYKYNKSKATWSKVIVTKQTGTLQNGRYRLFCGTTQNPRYENALFIRTLSKKAITKPMYKESVEKAPAPKKVALVFDAYDNADGLSKILSTLKKYNVKGTFFVNGEFINRYPAETKQICISGYPVGSMFFSQTDLVNNSFVVDEDFIRRGLARNEDEYYGIAEKELSLFWHAPYYSVSPKIIAAGQKAGYEYINSYNDFNDSAKLNKNIKPEYLIQKYLDSLRKTGGGIVPVTVGFSQGNRTDPLYNYLDLLICSLVDAGYEFVTADCF